MPSFKLTKVLYVKNLLEEKWSKLLNDSTAGGKYSELLKLLQAENAKEQIDQLKKVLKDLTALISKRHDDPAVEGHDLEVKDHDPDGCDLGQYLHCSLKFLVHLFFISTHKNPSRRVLVSTFQSLPADIQDRVICPAIERSLKCLYQQPIRQQNSDPIRYENWSEWRHHVDTVLALLENFSLGEKCVGQVCLETLEYLSRLQEIFFQCCRLHLSPVQQNELMHHCLETVKLANRICQRSSVVMETRLKDKEIFHWFIQISSSLLETDIQVLQKADFLIDCRTTSAMNICLLVRYSCSESMLVQLLLDKAFTDFYLTWPTTGSQDYRDWLRIGSFDLLSKRVLPSSSFLCLCYGVLSMVSMEILLLPCDRQCLLLDVLLREFLDLSKRCTDVGSKLLAAKSICLLTQRVRVHLQKISLDSLDPGIVSRLRGGGADVTLMLDFVWTSWEDTVEAVRFTVKDLFENLVSIHLLTTPSDCRQGDEFLSKLSVSILSDVSWSCKGKYGTLSVLVRHLGSARMLTLHDGIAMEVLQQLQEQTLSCYASDLYECLFRNHLSHLDTEQGCRASWFPAWVDPVITVLCGAGSLQRKHVLEYILPKLLKTGEATLYYMIQTLTARLFKEQEGVTCREDQSGKHKGSETGSQLGALIMCLRRARAMGQLQNGLSKSSRAARKDKNGSNTAKPDNSGHKGNSMPGLGDIERLGDKNRPGDIVRLGDKNRPGDIERPGRGGEMWCGVVDIELLRQALICRDEQIRLDAFALLCENQKTTETISGTERELIQGFIPQNLNNQNPAFRQHMLSLLKKFLTRMMESSHSLRQKMKKDPGALVHLKQYKLFLHWLTRYLFSGLYAGSVFARRSTCLGGLAIIKDIYSADDVSGEESFVFQREVRSCDIHTLLQCLTDTFEDNKLEASNILIGCSLSLEGDRRLTDSLTRELLEIALKLSCSTRPQDSTTAAHMFGVLLHQPGILNILQQHASKLTEAGNQAYQDESEAEHESEAGNGNEAVVSQNEIEAAVTFDQGQSEGLEEIPEADQMADQIADQMTPSVLEAVDVQGLSCMPDDGVGRRFVLLWILVKNLEEQARVAETNLIVAAASKPLYPTMQCMRHCLADMDFRSIPVDYIPFWQSLLQGVIILCLEISRVVSPVVHNCSPEGNVPVEAISGDAVTSAGGGMDDQVAKSHETVMLMPEYLVVCCWRSIKEISLILGQISWDVPIASSNFLTTTSDVPIASSNFLTTTSDVPIASRNILTNTIDVPIATEDVPASTNSNPIPTDDVSIVTSGLQATTIADSVDTSATSVGSDVPAAASDGLLSEKQILEIGSYFTSQLLESKHRGAFELAYAGFVKVTDMLWRSSLSELHRLPSLWLDQVMSDIQTGDQSSRLCATRRSAGVPFYIQALVSTEPVSTGRKCFRRTMDELLDLAYDSFPSAAESCDSKVHALNVLRAMFKDSRMKDDVTPYIADGLKVAILGFKSPLWAVRNSATLLMSAMMVRIFGVKRSKDETSFSRKNCQTGRTFFYNYPSLYQFLLDELTETTADVSRRLHPGLYPILMVLGRLFPSAMEGTDTSLNLAAFIPYIIKCSCSPVLKTRVMSARALQPLVEKGHVTSVFTDLLTLLPVQSGEIVKQNRVHGVLLQLRQMLGTVSLLSAGIQAKLSSVVLRMWSERMEWLVSRTNPCLLTRKEALEVSAEILCQFVEHAGKHKEHDGICRMLVRVLEEEVCGTEDGANLCHGDAEMAESSLDSGQDTDEGRIDTDQDDSGSSMAGNARWEPALTDQDDSGSSMAGNARWQPALWEYQTTVCRLYIDIVIGNKVNSTCFHGNGKGRTLQGHRQDNHSNVGDSIDETRKDDRVNKRDCKEKSSTLQHTENAILTFLKSSCYEVRRTILALLCDVSVTDDNQGVISVTGDNQSGTEPASAVTGGVEVAKPDHAETGQKYWVYNCLCESEGVYSCLVSMLESETNEQCQVLILRLLQVSPFHNKQTLFEQTSFCALPAAIDQFIGQIQSDDASDSLTAAVIEYLGVFIHALHASIPQEDRARYTDQSESRNPVHSTAHQSENRIHSQNVSDDQSGTSLDVRVAGIQRCIDVIVQKCSVSESAAEVHLACARALKMNCQLLFTGNHGYTTVAYKAVLDLLQVDDLDVKDAASDIHDLISVNKFKVQTHAYVSMDLLLDGWLHSSPDQHGRVPEVTDWLLDRIVENRQQTEVEEERLFDRGEANTYWDEIDYIQVLDAVLLCYSQGILTGGCHGFMWDKLYARWASKDTITESVIEALHKAGRTNTGLNCDRVTRVVNTYLEVTMDSHTVARGLELQQVFLNSALYESSVLAVFKTVTVLKYGLLYSRDRQCRKSCIQQLNVIRQKRANAVLPPLVCDRLDSVCKIADTLK